MARHVVKAIGLLRRTMILCALMLGLGSPAFSQEISSTLTPPVALAIDDNGVDLLSGEFRIADEQISIGANGSGRLGRTFYLDGRDNNTGTITYATATYGGTSGMNMLVSIGGKSEKFFRYGNGAYVAYHGNAATISQANPSDFYSTVTYTGSDGTVAIFDPIPMVDGIYQKPLMALLRSVTRPDGEKLTYTYSPIIMCSVLGAGCVEYTSRRLQSITSNFGYQIHYEYAATTRNDTYSFKVQKVTAVNMASDYCDPNANTCAAGAYAPTVGQTGIPGGFGTVVSTDGLGQQTTYIRTSPTLTIQKPSGAIKTVTYEFTSSGQRVTSVSDGVGTWTYSYAVNGSQLTVTVTDPAQHTRMVTSVAVVANPNDTPVDASNRRIIRDQNGLGQAETYLYDNLGRVTRHTQPEGDYTQYSYDARSNVVEARRVSKTPGSPADIVTTANYDAVCANPKTCNKPNYVIDERGGRTDFVYDPDHGGAVSVTSPPPSAGAVRPQTRYTFAPRYAWFKTAGGALAEAATPVQRLIEVSTCASSAACAGTAEESKTVYGYGTAGAANNLSPTTIGQGSGDGALWSTTTNSYDEAGNLRIADGPLAGDADATRYRYDVLRRQVGTIGPDPDGAGPLKHRATRSNYVSGRLASADIGVVDNQSDSAWAAFVTLKQAATTYDARDLPVLVRLSAGGLVYRVDQTTYDAAGRTTCTALRMNAAVFAALPASACELSTQGPDGPDRITFNSYDAADQLISVTGGYGTAQARVDQASTYTPNGEQSTFTDGNGNVTTYAYDGFDRVVSVRYPNPSAAGSSTSDYESFAYDAAGNITQERRRDGATVNSTYDALNRLTYRDGPKTWYSYDNLGRATYTYAGDAAERGLSQTYDGLGRPAFTYDYRGGAWSPVYSAYDLAGRRSRLQWPDGFSVSYDYDAANEVVAVSETGGAALATFAYDDLGRRKSISRANGVTTTYGYDAASRLVSLSHDLAGQAQDQTWTYDFTAAETIKSRTSLNDAYDWRSDGAASRTYVVNGLNQTTAAGPANLSYDARGNLTGDGAVTFGYDLDNRLITSSSAGHAATATYDPIGRLSQISGAATTRFVYSGQDLIGELDGSNAVLRRYVPGPSDDEPLVWYEGAGTSDRRWLLSDERGSIVAITNAAGAARIGASTSINTYDEYGVPSARNIGRHQYTGQTWLTEQGVYHYKARAYSPSLGRFLQPDPLGYDAGANLYAYVHGDPIGRKDPSGLHDAVGAGTSLGGEVANLIETLRVYASTCGVGVVCSSGMPPGIGHNGGPPIEKWFVPPVTAPLLLGVAINLAIVGPAGDPHETERLLLGRAKATGSALKPDKYHRAASFERMRAASRGTVTKLRDGVYLFEITGGLEGKAGVYEYILDKGKLTHQMWKDVPAPTGRPIR